MKKRRLPPPPPPLHSCPSPSNHPASAFPSTFWSSRPSHRRLRRGLLCARSPYLLAAALAEHERETRRGDRRHYPSVWIIPAERETHGCRLTETRTLCILSFFFFFGSLQHFSHLLAMQLVLVLVVSLIALVDVLVILAVGAGDVIFIIFGVGEGHFRELHLHCGWWVGVTVLCVFAQPCTEMQGGRRCRSSPPRENDAIACVRFVHALTRVAVTSSSAASLACSAPPMTSSCFFNSASGALMFAR